MKYPPLSYCFQVEIEGFPTELGFQQVSGLSANVEFEDVREGGINTHVHKVPVKTTFNDVTLKRGLLANSSLVGEWVREATEQFLFDPKNVTIKLLNPQQRDAEKKKQGVMALWRLEGAVPKSWELGDFNAEENAILIETLTLTFSRFVHGDNTKGNQKTT